MLPRGFLILLACLGIVLTVTVIPGVFTIDEDNYLVTVTALRHGGVTVPGTGGLPPSSELVWFDPNGANREVVSTPVASTAPPLYAPLALPFSWLGWRGLVALNTLAFLISGALVFALTARYSRAPEAPWIAALAFLGGGYALEYAQGMWPHMLTAALCTGAVLLLARVRDGGPLGQAVAAGVLAGLAAGIRYQNIVFAACVGLGALLLSRRRRWWVSTAYGAGVAIPVAVTSLLNHARLGFWNPISKGGSYLSSVTGNLASRGVIHDTVTMGWARVVDYSTRPPLLGTDHAAYLRADPTTGAYLIGDTVKKAWLQSSPWLALALLALVLVWWPRRKSDGARDRELRALSLVVIPTLSMFAASGVLRTDGLSYNQRYFIELVPLGAVALAWLLDPLIREARVWHRRLALGALLGVVLGLAVLVRPAPDPIRLYALLYLPLGLAAIAVLAWALTWRKPASAALALVVGATLGWSLAVHVGEDLANSRDLRRHNATVARALDESLPARAALFTYWGTKDPVGPLLLHRDLVVLDVRNDRGESARTLVPSLLELGRTPVVLARGMPRRHLDALAAGRPVRLLRPQPLPLVEIGGRPERAPAAP